jgi:hypothetical protein
MIFLIRRTVRSRGPHMLLRHLHQSRSKLMCFIYASQFIFVFLFQILIPCS